MQKLEKKYNDGDLLIYKDMFDNNKTILMLVLSYHFEQKAHASSVFRHNYTLKFLNGAKKGRTVSFSEDMISSRIASGKWSIQRRKMDSTNFQESIPVDNTLAA